MISRHAFYPVRDGYHSPAIRARWTGETRPPLKGEWYLSGAIIEAYRAPSDLLTPYHIARLVSTRTMIVEVA